MKHVKNLCLLFITSLTGCGDGSRQGVAGGSAAGGASERPVLIKVAMTAPPQLPGVGSPAPWIAERIEIASNGSIRMKIYEPGKLVKPFEVLGAVHDGTVDAGHAPAGFWQGKMSAAPLFSAIPFGPEASEYLAWMYYGNGLKLYQEMYDRNGYNVKVLICGVISPETSGWFQHEINSPADLKGLKMRFFGLGGEVMQELGVSVVLLPGGEIYQALDKKVIDATEYSMPAIDEALEFYKIVKYNYYPGWHQQATLFELIINKDVWNGLSASQQMILEMMCRAATVDTLAYTEAIQAAAIRRNVEEHGVKNRVWSPEMLQLFRTTWEKVVKRKTAEDEFFKKVWDDLVAFRAEYDRWESLGFLPRETSAP